MTTTAADDLRTNLIGSNVTYPLGGHAQGIIMCSPDGYMSAQLMRSDRPHLTGTWRLTQWLMSTTTRS